MVSPWKEIARRCCKIEANLPKDKNFIRVVYIAEALNAEILPTPLFVEATLASNKDPGAFSGKDWVVLIDSERFAESYDDILRESHQCPLSIRLRNSIAHELTHILGFNGESAKTGTIHTLRSGETQQKFIERIERDIEAISPLLLIPELAIKTLMEARKFSLLMIIDLLRQCQVSREVLIGCLNLAAKLHKTQWDRATGLNNSIIGIGVWVSSSKSVVYKWPTFVRPSPSIDRLIPEFINGHTSSKQIDFSDVLEDDSLFPLGGGADEMWGSIEGWNHRESIVRGGVIRF